MVHIPRNPASQQYVLHFTGTELGTGRKCIGVATASSPAGPFTGAAQPLLCPQGGAQDPSVFLAGSDWPQLIYRKNGSDSGIYSQSLTPDGQAISPDRPNPYLLYRAQPTWWHQGTVERPAVVSSGGRTYLFFSGGAANTSGRAVGWSPCSVYIFIVYSCTRQSSFGTWLAGNGQVAAPSGAQVFSDGTHLWLTYAARPGGSCTPTSCTGTPTMRIDKLCFAHGVPRTNGPTTTAQTLARTANCSTDIPGAPLPSTFTPGQNVFDDGTIVGQPSSVLFRDGAATVALDGRVLWLFSDTISSVSGGSRSNTAALGVPHPQATGPTWTHEPSQTPPHFVPYTQAELDYNQTHSCGPTPWVGCGRVANWELGALPLPDGSALALFEKHTEVREERPCQPTETPPCFGTGFYYDGIGAVRVRPGQTVADRANSPSGCNGGNETCLFNLEHRRSDEVAVRRVYRNPLIETVDGQPYVYLFGIYTLARAPLAQVESPGAWRFWFNDGTPAGTWISDRDQASTLPGLLEPAGDTLDYGMAQVTYNPYLDRYMNIAPDHRWNRSRFVIQTAENLWGPWTPEVLLYDSTPMRCSEAAFTYNPRQAPELTMDGGRTIGVSYARPRSGSCPGQNRYVTVRLG